MGFMSTILITGGNGMIGSAFKKMPTNHEVVFISRKEADLTDRHQVDTLFSKYKPDYVIHTAARVGGIGRNINSPVQQFSDNILMNTNVIDMSFKYDVKKLIAFSSICAFPAELITLSEKAQHDGAPYYGHASYAYAKRMVNVQIDAYRQQYGCNYCTVIPTNLFGENDNYHLEDAHVVPALIHKAFLYTKYNNPFIIWGNGESIREFVYSKDLCDICFKLLELDELPSSLIVPGHSRSVKQIVENIAKYKNISNIIYDESKPNGQKIRQTEPKIFQKYFPNYKFTCFDQALINSIDYFFDNYENIRK